MASTVVPPPAGAQDAHAGGGNKPMAFHSTESAEGDLHALCAELVPL